MRGARASGPLMVFVFWTARWVAFDATFSRAQTRM
jgi:hypothetical protein